MIHEKYSPYKNLKKKKKTSASVCVTDCFLLSSPKSRWGRPLGNHKCEHHENTSRVIGSNSNWISGMLNIHSGHSDVKIATANESRR